jgi:hypothetical protein
MLAARQGEVGGWAVTRIRRSEGHRWRLGAKVCGDDYRGIATENHLEKDGPYATVTRSR